MKSLDKKKELSKCCNANIEKLNDWGAEYMGCSKCFSAQSLDKKKIKYGEPCPECGLSWAHGSVKCSYPYPSEPKDYGSTGQTNQKSPDKMKPKELDWEKEFDKNWINPWNRNNFGIPKAHLDIKDFISRTLTKQRTELLEEIKNMPIEVVGNSQATVNQIIRLLNKKDE